MNRRIAIAVLLLFAWCSASTWATSTTPSGEAVLSIDEPDQAPALRSRVSGGDQVSRLPRHDLPDAAVVRDVPSPAVVLAALRAASPTRLLPHRRALARRVIAAPDEPS